MRIERRTRAAIAPHKSAAPIAVRNATLRLMWNVRRIIAIIVAAYLLLVLIDRFVLVELFVRRVGIPILLALAVSLACIGTGFLARRLRKGVALNFVIGYPIFGAICFLIALIHISPWTMVPVVGILGGIGLLTLSLRTGI